MRKALTSLTTLICLINVEGQINVEVGKAMNVLGKNPPMVLCQINVEASRLISMKGGKII